MKRILFYTDTPNFGGAEKQMALLAKALKQKGYSVSLAYGKYSQLAERRDELARIYDQFFEIPAVHKHDPRHYWQLGEILKQVQDDNKGFDLIHLHLWNPGACRYAFFAAANCGVPIVTTEHDPFELMGFKRWVKRACLKRTRHTIAISNEGLADLQNWYNIPDDRISLVHNGIELPLSSQSNVILRSATTKNLPNNSLWSSDGGDSSSRLAGLRMTREANDIVITCVAELHERKGHRYLFEAFERLQKTMPQLRLVLVGRGPLEKELKTKYGGNPRIHFLGWRDDVPEILKASDIFVLPSLKEAFGLSVLEAMANDVAVVATNSGGIKDIIENGKSGILVPPGDAEKLAGAIEMLLQNHDQKRDLETAAKKRVQEFSTERMAERTLEIYTRCHSEPAYRPGRR